VRGRLISTATDTSQLSQALCYYGSRVVLAGLRLRSGDCSRSPRTAMRREVWVMDGLRGRPPTWELRCASRQLELGTVAERRQIAHAGDSRSNAPFSE
jgi:hypothetical protein